MPTIPDPRPRPAARAARVRRRGGPLLPTALGLLVVLALVWRLDGDVAAGGTAANSAPATAAPVFVERTFGGASLHVPADWVVLDRSEGHVTWGATDRAHTVTLAATEASVLALPGIVGEVVRQSELQLPGATLVERPRPLELTQPAPRGDGAMLARFEVAGTTDEQPLQVAQVWRRDSRGGMDLVATWTSADGRWPVPLRSGIPEPAGSR